MQTNWRDILKLGHAEATAPWTWTEACDEPQYEIAANRDFKTREDAIAHAEFKLDAGDEFIVFRYFKNAEGDTVILDRAPFVAGYEDDGDTYDQHMRWECRQSNFV